MSKKNNNILLEEKLKAFQANAIEFVKKYRYLWDLEGTGTNVDYSEISNSFKSDWSILNEQDNKEAWDSLEFLSEINRVETFSTEESLYGYALVIYTIAIRFKNDVNIDTVNDLKSLIEDFDTKNKDCLFRYKQAMYQSLGMCYHKLGEVYNNGAINAFKKYLFNVYKFSNKNTDKKTVTVFSFRRISKHLFEALIDGKLNVSSPFTFNDPFDCPIISLLDSDENVSQLMLSAYRDTVKIASFVNWEKSRRAYLNNLMWAHYTDSHRGICIKYKFNESFGIVNKSSSSVTSIFGKVRYSDERLSNLAEKGNITADEAFTLKAKCWNYENELRYLYFDLNGRGDYDMVGNTNGCIEAVYFGLRCPESDRKAIIQILTCSKCATGETEKEGTISSIKFYQMEKNKDRFGMLKPVELKKRDIDAILR